MLPNLRVSCEVECYVDGKFELMNLLHIINRPDLIECDFIDMYRLLPDAILDHLTYISGIPGWGLDDNEASIMSDGDSSLNDFYTFEFITPITDYDTQIRILKMLFSFIDSATLKTNETCGLHVNVSYDGIESIPYEILLANVPEEKILEMFNRQDNKFCRSWQSKNLTVSQLYEQIDGATVEQTKEFSINFNKLEKGYIEFRMIGGVDYHRNDDVYTAIEMIVKGMECEFENCKSRVSSTR